MRELSEGIDDRLEVSVDIKVIFFEVVDQPDDWSVVVERSIELTRLGDENPRTPGIRAVAWNSDGADAAASADLRTIGPDDESRIEPAPHEHVTQHGGGRALAVRSSD